MSYWVDIFAQNPGKDMAALCRAAYRQFVLWQHGRLGPNIQRVIPSCIVLRIRERFPSASGVYIRYDILVSYGMAMYIKELISTYPDVYYVH